MSFHVGQPVVCIDARLIMHHANTAPLIEGKVYIVRDVCRAGLERPEHVRLREVLNGIADCGREFAYRASRFRPLVEDRKRINFTIGADPDSDRWDNRKKRKEKV